jgi:hypothetical protein
LKFLVFALTIEAEYAVIDLRKQEISFSHPFPNPPCSRWGQGGGTRIFRTGEILLSLYDQNRLFTPSDDLF